MGGMTEAFSTTRLRVFETTVKPYEDRGSQKVFLAYLLMRSTPQPVAYATVSDNRSNDSSLFPLYCDWVQAAPPFLKQGYGKELVLGIEKYLGGQMTAVASTPEGAALLKSLGRPTDSVAAMLEEMCGPVLKAPEFQAKLQEESQRNAALPPEENPMNPAFVGDRLRVFMEVAPLNFMRHLMTATDMTVTDRMEMLQRLAQSQGMATDQGSTPPAEAN